eukprot:9738997-Alexandrium_andersonii.AAC.1
MAPPENDWPHLRTIDWPNPVPQPLDVSGARLHPIGQGLATELRGALVGDSAVRRHAAEASLEDCPRRPHTMAASPANPSSRHAPAVNSHDLGVANANTRPSQSTTPHRRSLNRRIARASQTTHRTL